MSLFCKKHKDKSYDSLKCDFTLFGQKFKIDVLCEIEVDVDIPPDCVRNNLDDFLNRNEETEHAIRKYIMDNYRTIIEDYYLCLSYPSKKSKDYSDYLLLLDDYNNASADHLDIILKNIQLAYFSVIDVSRSYLFLFINTSDDYGIDVEIYPHKTAVHTHDI
ncbi:MAG: hypothetical protein K2J80_00855 [Oscillospiraceae bacterium]|nr:hypothetical protein [Oscillospiraceae bacterium]